MEDTLRERRRPKSVQPILLVLILVLMEDTLRDVSLFSVAAVLRVLILVLMEDTLRVKYQLLEVIEIFRLNPCSNGRYSQSLIDKIKPFASTS